jgi:hypothetical protein
MSNSFSLIGYFNFRFFFCTNNFASFVVNFLREFFFKLFLKVNFLASFFVSSEIISQIVVFVKLTGGVWLEIIKRRSPIVDLLIILMIFDQKLKRDQL